MEVHAHTHTPRKKWTHYFWEFIMLFLAVFCGFLAEYQLEHTIEHQREREYMKTMVEDLKSDTAQLTRLIGRRKDRVIELDEKDARIMARRLAREEAIFSGMSSGGAAHTAIELSKELEEGVIVFIVCDRGDRYLSSDLFD